MRGSWGRNAALGVKEARAFGPAEPVPAPDKHRPASTPTSSIRCHLPPFLSDLDSPFVASGPPQET
jgi:hypothetical protein